MNLKLFLKKIISKKNQAEFKASLSHEARAQIHWEIVIIIFLVAVLAVFFNSFWIYRNISRGEFFPVAKSSLTTSGPLTKKNIEAVVSAFEAKQVTFEQVRKSHTVLADPSR